jgi:murein DD-endopeptidase MepM/ murein hydrolase activator NlpD
MRRQDPNTPTRPNAWVRAAKGVALVATGGLFLMLQACSSTEMAQPKYPIYMQDKPAEAIQTPAQAGDDRPVVAPPSGPVAPQGKVATADLAPPPPPPPPPPSASSSASEDSAPAAPVKDTRAAFVYVLQPHDTLYGVSRRFGVPVAQIYDINGLAPNASLRIGQKILLPPSAVDKGVDPHAGGSGMVKLQAALAGKPAAAPATPVKGKPDVKAEAKTDTKPAAAKPDTARPAVAAPAKPTTFDAPAAKPETKAPVAEPVSGFPSNEKLSLMGRGMFGWPLRGKILVPFGQLAPNVRNDGINIAAESGTDVKAAADGVVVYEGNQVKELGNTVYIKHANGWYTGYSHLATMNVQNNQHVTKGQVIGTAGQTGVIDRPQLHFEIRYTPSTDIARPIDPMLVLPQ